MKLENTFTVPAGIDQAWVVFNDPRQVGPCFPGAKLESYEDDSFIGTVKVKLGPISLTYKGKGTFVERDEAAHKVVIEASGRDSRGNGTASATVTGTLTADGDTQTSVTMVTDMTVTGRPAQFGRGIMADISDMLVAQFSSCLANKLGAAAEPSAAESADAATPDAATPDAATPDAATPDAEERGTEEPAGKAPKPGSAAVATATAAPVSAVGSAGPSTNGLAPGWPTPAAAQPYSSEVDAIDLLDTAGAPVLKRLAPFVIGLVLLLIILRSRMGRKN